MNLSHLEAFCQVIKSGSITRAAKELHISQPGLSLQIKDLEKILQTNLLDRSTRGVSPTTTGKILFDYGTKILNLADNMQKEIDKQKDDSLEELIVGASCTMGNFALPCSVYIFKENFVKHSIQLDISSTRGVLEKLAQGEIKIGVIEGPLSNSLKEIIKEGALSHKKIAQDELVIIAPYDEKWKDINEIIPAELPRLNLILREKGCGIRETVEDVFAKHDIDLRELNVLLELNSSNAIISSVAAGKGISILPKMSLRKELRHRTLKAVKLQGITFSHPIHLLHTLTYPKDSLSATFIDFLSSPARGFC